MKRSLLFLLFVLIPIKVNATCDSAQISRLSNNINNININYEYNYNTKDFTITFTNLTPEFVVRDLNTNIDYVEDIELQLNNMKSGNQRFEITSIECRNSVSKTKYIKLPYYNTYHDQRYCNDKSDFEYCDKWIKDLFSESTFETKIIEYNQKQNEKKEIEVIEDKTTLDIISDFLLNVYVRFYYILLPLMIIGSMVVIYKINKKDTIL